MNKVKEFVRRAGAVTLAAIMVLSSTGCAGKGEQQEKGGTDTKVQSSEPITLRILENDTAKSLGYLDELLKAFNEKYADQGITAVDANMEEYSNLAENGPYGYGPDVIYQANDKLMTYAADKHIMALDVASYECCSKLPSTAVDAFKINVDGKDYYCGIPINVQEPMLFYRADLMPENWENDWDDNKNGVADFFENWNDLYAYSLYLREHDTSANKDSKYGLVASLNDLYMMAEFIFSYGGYVGWCDLYGMIDFSAEGVPEDPYMYYDVNLDGTVNAADELALVKYILCDNTDGLSADLNGDGNVNVFDRMRLMAYIINAEG